MEISKMIPITEKYTYFPKFIHEKKIVSHSMTQIKNNWHKVKWNIFFGYRYIVWL